jgi:amino acid transporter
MHANPKMCKMPIREMLNANFFRKKPKDENLQGFGTFYGVYLPGILSMFGAIIYLRFGWIIGSLGLFQTILVVFMSCFIVFVTVLSIASSATNRHVGGGGTYYMVSRSLGIEIGSAIGIPLFIAQALLISFCSVGFAESIHPFFPTVPIPQIGLITLFTLIGLVYFSAAIALKTQLFIFLIIIGSLVSLFLGKGIPPESITEPFNESLVSPFWVGFALFFPATTGVESGVSMSGNLRSPRKSLPLGTIAVLLTGFIVYMSIPFFLWTHAPRTLLVNDTLIFQHVAKFQPLILAGIWAATLSTVLSGLLAAPRTLQALALDGVFPKVLAKEWGKNKEPRIATLFCFIFAIIGILYGTIDKIAPILTMFYLISYATLNLATGLEELLGNPSWRPTFRIHWSIPIMGVILCLLAMFMIDSGYTILALIFVIGIYLFMKRRNLEMGWEDIRYGVLVFLSRFAIYGLAQKQFSQRSWRPNLLVLSEKPIQVSHLINVAAAMCKGKGFLTLASIFSPNIIDYDRAERWKKMVDSSLKENGIEALVEFCLDESFLAGAKKLLGNYGIGSISPNTIALGEMKRDDIRKEYLEIIDAIAQAKKNILIVRDNPTNLKLDSVIHIWWDELNRANSELMLLLSHMLTSNRAYRKSAIFINCIVPNEVAKEQRLKYFNDFLSKCRFSVTPQIHINKPDQTLWEIMTSISASADLVLLGMQTPQSQGNIEAFGQYYDSHISLSANIPNTVFVCCAEQMDTKEIFH